MPSNAQMPHPRPAPFDVVGALRRQFFIILSAGFIIGGMGFLAQRNATPMYIADGSLILRFEKEYFPQNPARTEYQGEPIRTLIDGAVQTEIEILGSRGVAERTIAAIGYAGAEDQIHDVLPAFFKALSIRRVEGTQVVRVSFKDEDPELAKRAVDALFDSYFDRRETLFESKPEDVLRPAAKDAREELTRLRLRLADLQIRSEEAIAAAAAADAQDALEGDDLGPSRSAHMKDLVALQVQANSLQTDIRLAEERYEAIAAALSEQELVQQIAKAQGTAIRILEVPDVDPNPAGLSDVATGILAGLVGLVVASLIAIGFGGTRTARSGSEYAAPPRNWDA